MGTLRFFDQNNSFHGITKYKSFFLLVYILNKQYINISGNID